MVYLALDSCSATLRMAMLPPAESCIPMLQLSWLHVHWRALLDCHHCDGPCDATDSHRTGRWGLVAGKVDIITNFIRRRVLWFEQIVHSKINSEFRQLSWLTKRIWNPVRPPSYIKTLVILWLSCPSPTKKKIWRPNSLLMFTVGVLLLVTLLQKTWNKVAAR